MSAGHRGSAPPPIDASEVARRPARQHHPDCPRSWTPEGDCCCLDLTLRRPNSLRRVLRAGRSEPDWRKACEVCGALPTMPATGMCGPCTFGEAATAGGNW